jgi:PKD repeat protein
MKAKYGVVVLMFLVLAGMAYADNAPTIGITAQPSTTVDLTVVLSGTAADLSDPPMIAGVREIKVYEDNQVIYTYNCGDSTTCSYTKSVTHATAGTHTYYATAKDKGNNIGTSSSIAVTFRGPNLVPDLSQIPDKNVSEDSGPHPALIDLWNFVTDDRLAPNQLTYTLYWQQNTSLVNCAINDNQNVSCTLPTPNAFGESIITIEAHDGQLYDRKNITITVWSVNDAPWLNLTIPNLVFPEDTYNDSVNLTDHFKDIETYYLDYSFIPSNVNITVTENAGIMNITSAQDYFGLFSLMIIASDNENATNTTINVTVLPVNDAPYFNPALFNQSAIRFLPFLYDINASDVDPGDILTYTSNETLFVIDPNTGLINFTPMISGNRSVNVTVCDNSAAPNDCTSSLFNLEIIYIPRPGFVNNTPLNATYFDPGFYELFITIVPSSTMDTVLFEYTGVNRTATLVSGNTYKINLTEIPAGNHTYRWHANYTNSLSNTSILYNFELFQAMPELLMSILPPGPVEYGTLTNTTCYSNTSQISTFTLSLNGNPILNPDIRRNVSAGYNNYTCTTPGNQNYTFASITQFLNITPRVINMTFNGPSGSLPYLTQTNYNCSIDFNQTTPILERNSTAVSNPDINVFGVGSYNYTCYVPSTINWYGVSETKLLSITPLTTTLTLNAPTTLIYGTPMNVNCSADNNQSIVTLMRNGTTVSNPDTSVLNAGTYNYTCTATGTPNYTDASVTNFVNITKATPFLTLELNGINGNVYFPVGGGVTLINSTRGAIGEVFNLYVNDSLITFSPGNIMFMYNYTNSGWYNVTVSYPGSANYNGVSKTHYVAVGSPLIRSNFNPASGSHFNTTAFTLSFNTNINSSCRWDFTDSAYANMTTDFTTTGITNHSTLISGLNMGTNNVYAACVNDTIASNENLVYTVDNIMDSVSTVINNGYATGSRINTTVVDNSAITNVNTTNSVFNRSTLNNCVVINSLVKDYTGSNCYIINSVIDPSDVTGSTINTSVIMNSNATNSYIDHSNITNSNIDSATVIYSTLTNITMNGGSVYNTNLQDAILTDVVIDNGVITNGTITQGGTTYNASINGTANLTQIINLPPSASFTMPATAAPGAVVNFDASSSSDPNIGQSGPYNSTNMTYSWSFGDGNTSTGVNPTHVYNAEATYIVTMTVRDAYGLNDTTTQSIVISTPVAPPPVNTGGGGGGGGGGSYGLARTYNYDLESGMTFQRSLTKVDKLFIKYKDVEHLLTVSGITRDEVTILVDDKVSKLINKQIQNYDLDDDHYYDMEVAFVHNYITRAEFRIRPIQELIPGYNPFSTPTPVVVSEPEPELISEPQPIKEPEETPEETTEEPEEESKFWSKFKSLGSSITGAVAGISDNEQVGGLTGIIILIAVIVLGIILYWGYSEWF